MTNKICFCCFKWKDGRKICPYCGYEENAGARQAYQLLPGTVLRKRYVIGTSIGIGGFGITYKAFDVTLRFVVAIKEFYPAGLVNRAAGDRKVGIFSGEKEREFERQLSRFLEEARNMALFSKEQDIVNVYDYFEENRTAYIIMEYVDAPLLKDELRRRRFSVEEATRYMFAILNALEKIHAKSIIHKDISPDNIFLTDKGSIKLFDFGAARLQGTDRTEAVVVKAGYTPPEQYTAKDTQGITVDIYAAGAVFYEMLTGEKPMDSRDRIIRDDLGKLEDFGVKADEYLERVVFKAMALEPRLRFSDTKQFKNALFTHKKVKIPQEEIRKNRRMKRILTVGLIVVIVLMGGIVGLNLTVFSGRGKIDMEKIRPEELSIWLSAEESEDGEELADKLLESVEYVCPQLTVHVEVINNEEYAGRLKQAMEQENLPDVFCTDGTDAMNSGNSDIFANLSNLMHTLNLSDYLYLSDMGQEVYMLPTAMQIGVVYISQEKERETPQDVDLDKVTEQGTALGYADEANVYTKFQDADDSTKWIVGDLSDLGKVESVTVDAVPSTDFFVAPILKNQKLIGNLVNWYAVKKSESANRQNASMVLLSLLLSEGMQSTAYMDNDNGLPLNQVVLENYKDNKLTTYLNFIREYNLKDVELYNGDSLCCMVRDEIEKNRNKEDGYPIGAEKDGKNEISNTQEKDICNNKRQVDLPRED